ncbi:MAG: hypothetical protein VKS61_02980 [Candidatus Sericytochromatia bacterium]|jgi:hypothetical protein|nr:hypothetical protein [Candidatus Sericytochromatia bacterium]
MIEAEVHRNGQLLLQRTYSEPSLSLEAVLKQLEMYIVNEQLNNAGECLLRVRFGNLQKAT